MAPRKSRFVKDRVKPPSKLRLFWTLGLAIALFILTRAYILFVLEPLLSDTRFTYFISAVKAYDGHFTPYQDGLQIVYPPVAWWAIYAPRFFDSRHVQDEYDFAHGPLIRATYCQTFRVEMCLFDIASFVLLWKVVQKRQAGLAGWAALTYTATTAIFGHLLYDRLDVGLSFFLLAWAFCWIKSMEASRRSIAWSAAAYACVGLGFSYKIVPIIIIPFLILADLKSTRRGLRLATSLLALIATATLPFAIQYSISGPQVFDLFQFHSQRGVQIESIYSTLMMIGSLLGWDVFIIFAHGGFNLAGDLSKLMIHLSIGALLIFLACAWLRLFFSPSEIRRQEGYRMTCFVLVAAVILSRVLSPQYFIWGLTMSLLLAVELFPNGRAQPWALTVLWLIIAGLSTWLFPYHYLTQPGIQGLASNNPLQAKILYFWPCMILGLRNLAYLGLVVWLGMLLFRRSGLRPQLES
jgi:hypothetical protein